jgi:hypothetical protein
MAYPDDGINSVTASPPLHRYISTFYKEIMNKAKYTIITLSLLFSTFALAGVKEKAVELMELMEIRKNIDASMGQISSYMEQMIESQDLDPKAKEAVKAASKKSMAETFQAMKEMNWESMFGEIYSEVFTEEELQGLIDFYKSPVGKKFLEKQPELMDATMTRIQTEMAKFMPMIQEATMTAVQEAMEQSKTE